MTLRIRLLVAAHERREHRGQPDCPSCRSEDPVAEASWVRRAHERRLPVRIIEGVAR